MLFRLYKQVLTIYDKWYLLFEVSMEITRMIHTQLRPGTLDLYFFIPVQN